MLKHRRLDVGTRTTATVLEGLARRRDRVISLAPTMRLSTHRDVSRSSTALLLLTGVIACNSVPAPGNAQNVGGNLAIGGSSAQAGAGGSSMGGGSASSGLGGTVATSFGGTSATGGTTPASTGGSKNTGGSGAAIATGGTGAITSTGGTKTTGGTTSITNTGGVTNSGATSATGGTKGTGGSSSTTGGSTAKGTGGVATGGASSTVPTGLPTSCGSNACDGATTVNPQLTSYGALGNVTMYSTNASNGGACLYGATSVMYYAAINVNLSPGDNKGQWQGGSICGQCMQVTVLTSQGTKDVVVRIMDKCPDGFCGIDLGGLAPAAVMVDGIGRYQGAWRAVSCAGHPEVSDGPPSIYTKDGSSPGWSVIQVRNPVTGVAGIDYVNKSNSSQSGTLAASSGIENFYQVPVDVLQAGANFDFTVRYVDGTSATITLSSDQLGQAQATYPLN